MRVMIAVPLTLAMFCELLLANQPPDTPTVTSPASDGQIVNPADVHMETAPFSDPDSGDTHLCTAWELWTVNPEDLVWSAEHAVGVERVHIHLGDGTFLNSHLGREDLLPDATYELRVRHCDSSGDSDTEWSAPASRLFHTAVATQILPLTMDDVLDHSDMTWQTTGGASVDLPFAPDPPRIRLESGSGDLLLEIRGQDGPIDEVINPPPLDGHVPVRVRISAGTLGSGLVLPETDMKVVSGDAQAHAIYLPAVSVPAGLASLFWVDSSGATYFADEAQTGPDFTQPAREATIPWTVLEPGFSVEVVATGFQLPVNIAFVPNRDPTGSGPLFYVAELYGTIKAVYPDGSTGDYATGLLNFDPTGNFPGSGEQGLTGLVVEPGTGDLFVSLLYDVNTDHFPEVLRLASDDGGNTAARVTVVLDMAGEVQGESHQISNLSLGPDGKLYVHMGDGFDVAAAQNLDSFRGKILRMNLDGTPPADNPFYDAADGVSARDYVYARGFRNPFGGAWRVADGMHYEVENGDDVDRFAQVVPGRNYLWDGSDASMYTGALFTWFPSHAPVNLAFVEPNTFGGSGFPPRKMGHAYVSESGATYASGPQPNGKRISEFVLDAAGNLLSGPTTLIEYFGTGKATVVALAAGPDGLYFSDFYQDLRYSSPIDPGARILRVRYILRPGDLNCDGVVNVADINAFVLALRSRSAYEAAFPQCDWLAGDFNGDNQVNYADIGAFLRRLSGP